MEFFIFVNRLHIVTKHNLDYTGCLCGVDLEGSLSPFGASVMGEPSEEDGEAVRRESFPQLPSRLQCVFAFGDYPSCELASAKYGWQMDSVERFILLQLPGTRIHRANMEIVSFARGFYQQLSPEARTLLWRNYWSGSEGHGISGIPSPDVLWEYLIIGRLGIIK